MCARGSAGYRRRKVGEERRRRVARAKPIVPVWMVVRGGCHAGTLVRCSKQPCSNKADSGSRGALQWVRAWPHFKLRRWAIFSRTARPTASGALGRHSRMAASGPVSRQTPSFGSFALCAARANQRRRRRIVRQPCPPIDASGETDKASEGSEGRRGATTLAATLAMPRCSR